MNCPDCLSAECCNKQLGELRNGVVSLSYVHKCFNRGHITPDLLERMIYEIRRIETALEDCYVKKQVPK